MNQYLNALIYVILGFIGGAFHYAKKRYVDQTTEQDFLAYLFDHRQSTFKAVATIIAAEYALSLSSETLHILTLPELVGALTAGYTADSSINKTGS